jgi:hypothetical protein
MYIGSYEAWPVEFSTIPLAQNLTGNFVKQAIIST